MDGDVLKKGGLRPPFLFADLLTQTQLCNDCTIAVDVLLGKIVKQASALTDHHQKTAAGSGCRACEHAGARSAR